MSRVICVMGESGAGKTTAARTLPPGQTCYFDCDGKGLSWQGWKKSFCKEKHNYFPTDDPQKILDYMARISEKSPQTKYIVVDTLNGIMIADEMRRAKEKGYDKWMDLAQSIWDIVNLSHTFREDLNIIFLAHCQTERDESGYYFTKMKSNGKKIEKIQLETKFTTVLLAKKVGCDTYVFDTRAENSTVKTPMGLYTAREIPNDLLAVISALEQYESEEAS